MKDISTTTREMNKKSGRCLLLLLCGAMAGIVLLVCSTCSPLFPLNQWMDANIYFTIGRGMLKGLVPYRDLIDQKGLIFFAVQMLGALISNKSFFGVWVMEVIAATVFLYYSAKTVELFTNKRWAMISVPVLAAVVYTSAAFSNGDSAEEFALPLLAFAFYLFCRIFAAGSDWLPSGGLLFANGVGAALIFWGKYTMIGLHFAWMSSVALYMWYKKRSLWKAVQACLAFLGGMAAVSVMVTLYFALNGALSDLGYFYFYKNMFEYSNPLRVWLDFFYNIFTNGLDALQRNLALFGLCIVGGLGVLFSKKLFGTAGKVAFLWLVAGQAVFIWTHYIAWLYSAILFAVFACIGFVVLAKVCEWVLGRRPKLSGHFFKLALAGICICCGVASYFVTGNASQRFVPQEQLVQTKIANIVKAQGGQSLHCYNMVDQGFYLMCEILPSVPYFTRLNFSNDGDLKQQVEEKITQGGFDFVITLSDVRSDALDSSYEKIATERNSDGGELLEVDLYKRLEPQPE